MNLNWAFGLAAAAGILSHIARSLMFKAYQRGWSDGYEVGRAELDRYFRTRIAPEIKKGPTNEHPY